MKEVLRKKYLLVRKNIGDKEFRDSIIFLKIIYNKQVVRANTILIYVSLNEEVDTKRLIEYFLSIGKKVAVPKILNGKMNFYYIESLAELRIGFKNILEPINNRRAIDFSGSVSITPGICFSKKMYRIGYGMGFYDKFYQMNDVYKIGVCYKELLIEDDFSDIYDVAVDEIITD